MAKNSEPKIVAELGRPETPEETAARKAQNSKLHRQRQTANNLFLSLLVSLGVVLILVLIVPRGVGDFEDRSLDLDTIAVEAQNSVGIPLVNPDVPDTWLIKQANIRTSKADRVTHWHVVFTTPSKKFAGVTQAFTPDLEPANETWVAERLERKLATDTKTLAGHEWTVYDHQGDNTDSTNVTYALTTDLKESVLLIYGTAPPEEIEKLAEEAIASLQK